MFQKYNSSMFGFAKFGNSFDVKINKIQQTM